VRQIITLLMSVILTAVHGGCTLSIPDEKLDSAYQVLVLTEVVATYYCTMGRWPTSLKEASVGFIGPDGSELPKMSLFQQAEFKVLESGKLSVRYANTEGKDMQVNFSQPSSCIARLRHDPSSKNLTPPLSW